jgi:lipopolysaccharide export system protein LptA
MMGAVMAQQKKSIVRLIRSEKSEGFKRGDKDVVKVFKGTFQQDYSTLTSDSAYFYPQDNAFDAFGNVNINQGDTLNIFSDKLNYNGNTKTALLTDRVKMVDKDATLTTDYFTYNTATRIGRYTGGGTLVNKDNTLTSKNGTYFAGSRDAYFKYDVVLNTVDALIKTDTLRYNSGSRIAYFYGPTNIYGKAKDKDTLYTEDGLYNTVTQQAFFGKKNLYKQGTKSLKGDSLFYDRLKGYGRAVKRVTFTDTEQKVTIKGDLGTYYKKDERAVITQNAYVVLITEDKDSTATDSTKKLPLVKKDSVTKAAVKKPGKPAPGDPDVKAIVKQGQKLAKDTALVNTALKNAPPETAAVIKQGLALAKDTALVNNAIKNAPPIPPGVKQTIVAGTKKMDSLAKGALKNNNLQMPVLNKKAVALTTKKPAGKPGVADKNTVGGPTTVINDKGEKVKQDSVFMSADTLETRMLTYKELKILKEKMRLANVRDTTTRAKKKELVLYKTAPKVLAIEPPVWRWDTTYRHRDFFGKPVPKKVDSAAIKKAATLEAQKKTKADSLKKLGNVPGRVDSVYMKTKVKLSDTSRIRLINAYHDAKIFKSDLQAKADSISYANSDSTIRCYVKPIMWTQGSQISGDTIDLQMKNKKLDNMDIYYNSFTVNIEKDDSTHFNQVGGKKMRGFFRNSKLDLLYVDGNSESIYFSRDSATKKVENMQRSLSSRLRIRFKDGKASSIALLSKPDIKVTPFNKTKEDDRILKGFIWKPKERPVSKEAIIYSARRKAANKIAAQAEAAAKAAKNPPRTKPGAKTVQDSTQRSAAGKTDSLGTKKAEMQQITPKLVVKDSVINVVPNKAAEVNSNRITDGTLNTAPVILPAVVQPKDTSTVKPPPAKKDSTLKQ